MVGHRNAALLERAPADTVGPGMVVVAARRPLLDGVTTYAVGERIEGAEHWPRLDARIRAGIVAITTADAAKEHVHMTTREDVVARFLRYDGYLNGAGYDVPNRFSSELGRPGEAWCFDSYTGIYVEVGLPLPVMQLGCRTGGAYVPDAEYWAKEHDAWKSSWEAEPGDGVIFDWNGDGIADHIEMAQHWLGGQLLTIGGNSGPSNVNGYKGRGGVHQHAWQAPAGEGNEYILGVLDASKAVHFGSVAVAPPSIHSLPTGGPRLLMLKTPNMTGEDVARFQVAVNEHGYRPELKDDGDYGPKSAAACRWVEEQKHLGVDSGVVGPRVRAALGL